MSPLQKKLLLKIFIVSIVFLAINFIAALIIMEIENLDYTDSFYMTMSASVTSGYGNVAPETKGGKWFISFFQLLGFGVLFYLLTLITVNNMEKEKIIP